MQNARGGKGRVRDTLEYQGLDWFSKVRAAKGRFNLWISCRFAEIVFSVPVCERRFLRCSSVVDVHPRPHHALNSCARRLGLSRTDF